MTDWKDRLIEGYREFRAGDFPVQKALYEELGTKGQKPKVMLIACSDSRADPSDIFNACLLYTSPSPRDRQKTRMPSSA